MLTYWMFDWFKKQILIKSSSPYTVKKKNEQTDAMLNKR